MSFADAPGIAAMRFTTVPEDQRQEYSTVFDNLWRFIIEVDPKMTMYAVLLPEDLVRRLIAMVRSHDASLPSLFLIYNLGIDLPTTTVFTLFEPAEVSAGISSSEDDDRPSTRMHRPFQSSFGCHEWR